MTFDGLLDEEITAFQTLKAELIEPLVLALPHSKNDYTVETDACEKQMS